MRTGKYRRGYFLVFCMDHASQVVYKTGDQVIPELLPLFNLRGILRRLDIDSALFLKISHALVTVAIVILRVFLVHNKSILIPQSTGKYYIGETNIIEMNAIHFRDIGNRTIQC